MSITLFNAMVMVIDTFDCLYLWEGKKILQGRLNGCLTKCSLGKVIVENQQKGTKIFSFPPTLEQHKELLKI